MGEDRTMCVDKRSNDVNCRHRHSSVISSCSEESESTSAGYPPTPDEDREQELEYGPGIVNKLRTRFLSITLKQNRNMNMRRSCSLENLLDQERPSSSNIFASPKGFVNNGEETGLKKPVWGNLKRAKSMDTLLLELQPEPPLIKNLHEENGGVKKEPKIIRRREGALNRAVPTICDEELPKPDTVKTYKRMFEPAESKRGSHSRRPPVLRASAKSGALSAIKINGTSSNSSAKITTVATKTKFSAKPCSPVKAQSYSDTNNCDSSIPIAKKVQLVNGESAKTMCNGNSESSPFKNGDISLCNGNKEEILNNRNLGKKELHFAQKKDIICNGNGIQKEVISKLNESVKPSNSNKIATNLNGTVNSKPKVPPNRPLTIKPPKNVPKLMEQKCDKTPNILPPKIKTKPIVEMKKLKPKSEHDKKLNSPIQEIKLKDINVLEENRKNVEKSSEPAPEVAKVAPENPKLEKLIQNGVDHPDTPDNQKAKLDTPKQEMTDSDAKPVSVKKSQGSAPATSMVFDFRGKDVVPHVAVLPVPFGCKALHPKKRPLLIDGKEAVGPCSNGESIDDEDDDFVDYSVPPPCGLVFEGENVKVGRGSILATRNKDLKIQFNEEVDSNTFIYPSESSLLEESERTKSPTENEVIPNSQSPTSKLKSNTTIGSSSVGGLFTYTPSVLRTMDNFQPGMFRQPPSPVLPEKDEDKCKNIIGEEENTEIPESIDEQDMLKPADPDLISSWSLSAGTSDLLF